MDYETILFFALMSAMVLIGMMAGMLEMSMALQWI